MGACLSTIVAEFTVTTVQFYFIKDFINPKKLIKPVLLFIPAAIVMYIVVRIIGSSMGAGLLTNILQALGGMATYFIIIEISCKLFKKMSIIKYVKNIMNN